ncbi:type VI secretion system Vgr family protein [Burkholderia sp. BCC0322]|uniref:type VI secretion system Vgr family protein n=1 Tax=unclassified Burkholderia TaxID=2613784 RepID=UPI001FC7BE63|nr:type VI secretion system Vgr family protein [Burkholderia sp. BCC0322]
MGIRDTFNNFATGAVDWNQRPVGLNFGQAQGALGHLLALQHADIQEGLMTGIHGALTCVSARHHLPPKLFMGMPVSVQIATDRGQQHCVNAIIRDVQAGQSDGDLCVYQLTVCDALSLMDKRTNSRIFRKKNVVDVLTVMLSEWRDRSPALARAFEFDLSNLNRDRYPARELTRQVNESDAKFMRRLLRRDGITVFAKSGPAKGANGIPNEPPVHTLVFCDDPMRLPEAPAGAVRLHPRDAGTEQRDTITLFALHQQLVSGEASRPSWDYKKARVDQYSVPLDLDQGEAGNDLARLLTDVAIDIPHAGDSWADLDRLTQARIHAHQFAAERVNGVSSVRDLAVGTYITVTGDVELDMQSVDQRQFVVTSIRHDIWNNLPKDLSERARALFEASRHLSQVEPALPASLSDSNDTRYENTFTAVRRGVPLTPAYDPGIDLPPVHLLTGVIVTHEGEEVVCDKDGRVHVQLQGLNPTDHEHAAGAGTNGDAGDSVPIRVSTSLAGVGFGATFLPRAGMEVLIDCISGDPDRLVITGVLPNGVNTPTAFTHTGSLPGNRYVSGIKTQEIKGRRYNQLRMDDTPNEISTQLGSEHAHSQLNLGNLTHPRENGHGQARGEGAELRTDAAAAVRAARGILLTAYARTRASGDQLDRDELITLLSECSDLFKSLGDYAGQHGGQAADTTGQQAVATAFKQWHAGDVDKGTANAGAAPSTNASALMAIGAPGGSVNLTPKTHVTYAGENVDQVAQQHMQFVSGQRLTASAGQGVHLFGRGEGVRAIAGDGPLMLQAQQDNLSATAKQGIQITATDGDVVISGKSLRLVAEDGSYIKIGGGVRVGSNSAFTVHTNGHDFLDADTDHVAPQTFGQAGTDQKFRLRYPGTDSSDGVHPVPNRPYKITLNNGQVIQGVSDQQGLTQLAASDAMHIAHVQVFDAQG